MEFTAEIRKATEPIYQKISKAIPEIEWSNHAPYIYKINQLKKKKNAVILAHNYQTPEIFHGISDFSADSLALAVEAAKTKADIIVMCGVHFMAETIALLKHPHQDVWITNPKSGCTMEALAKIGEGFYDRSIVCCCFSCDGSKLVAAGGDGGRAEPGVGPQPAAVRPPRATASRPPRRTAQGRQRARCWPPTRLQVGKASVATGGT